MIVLVFPISLHKKLRIQYVAVNWNYGKLHLAHDGLIFCNRQQHQIVCHDFPWHRTIRSQTLWNQLKRHSLPHHTTTSYLSSFQLVPGGMPLSNNPAGKIRCKPSECTSDPDTSYRVGVTFCPKA